jgi:hypothetical protein
MRGSARLSVRCPSAVQLDNHLHLYFHRWQVLARLPFRILSCILSLPSLFSVLLSLAEVCVEPYDRIFINLVSNKVVALNLDMGPPIGNISASAILNVADPALSAVRHLFFHIS